MNGSREPPEGLSGLEVDLEALFVPAPSAEMRPNVIRRIQRELHQEAVHRRAWTAGEVAMAVALGINLVWSAGLWLERSPGAARRSIDVEEARTCVREALPDLPEAAALGHVARLRAA